MSSISRNVIHRRSISRGCPWRPTSTTLAPSRAATRSAERSPGSVPGHLVDDRDVEPAVADRLFRVWDLSGAQQLARPERRGDLEPLVGDVGDRDAKPELARRVDEERPDAACADHESGLAGLWTAAVEGVHCDRHGLGERGGVVTEAVGADVEACFGRHCDVLGEPSVPLQPHGRVRRGEIRPVAGGRFLRTGDVAGAAGDEHPVREAVNALSHLDDASGELVAGNERAYMAGDGMWPRDRVDRGSVLPLGGVRPAHTDGVHLEQQLPGGGYRIGRLLHP